MISKNDPYFVYKVDEYEQAILVVLLLEQQALSMHNLGWTVCGA
ncbi:hypothetical protein [Pseudoalteromonas luteoviolacea]|nr:hypothetical protein [Pseudoalteromonas luteoviolacea]